MPLTFMLIKKLEIKKNMKNKLEIIELIEKKCYSFLIISSIQIKYLKFR